MHRKLTRRDFAGTAAAAAFGMVTDFGLSCNVRAAQSNPSFPTARETFGLLQQGKKIPVIFDTDIGNDIDDTWALVMALKCPELDVRLVVSDGGNTIYRAKILAKMLEVCGRTDIPVGVGVSKDDQPGAQSDWIGDYTLDRYPGIVHQDGVETLIETILKSKEPMTLVCVGPVPNISAALKREPRIVKNARFVGMHGSVRRGYRNGPKPSAEWNVRANPKALQDVFAAPWDITITPLDTCGVVHLTGGKYQKVYRCKHPETRALMENYQVWAKNKDRSGKRIKPSERSSTLFDTVAVYLAYSEQLTTMETLPLRVTDEGFTAVDKNARAVHCAMTWKDRDAFENHLVSRLTGS